MKTDGARTPTAMTVPKRLWLAQCKIQSPVSPLARVAVIILFPCSSFSSVTNLKWLMIVAFLDYSRRSFEKERFDAFLGWKRRFQISCGRGLSHQSETASHALSILVWCGNLTDIKFNVFFLGLNFLRASNAIGLARFVQKWFVVELNDWSFQNTFVSNEIYFILNFVLFLFRRYFS